MLPNVATCEPPASRSARRVPPFADAKRGGVTNVIPAKAGIHMGRDAVSPVNGGNVPKGQRGNLTPMDGRSVR